MEFGKIVRQRREERGWNTRTLAAKSGLDRGAISRIENGDTQILVKTTILLCKSLKIDPLEIFQDKNLEYTITNKYRVGTTTKYLSVLDIKEMVYLFRNKPISTIDSIVGQFRKYTTKDNYSKLLFDEYTHKRSLNDNDNMITNIINILETIPYPDGFDNKILIDIMNHGGIITLRDIGHYMKSIRKSHSMTQLDLQKASGMPDSTLSNWEKGIYKKIKLDDLLILEKALKTNGELTALFWNTWEFHPVILDDGSELSLSNDEMTLSEYIVCSYRWLQTEKNENAEKWLESMRTIIGDKISN